MAAFLLAGCDTFSISKVTKPGDSKAAIGTRKGAITEEGPPSQVCGDNGAPECVGKSHNDECGVLKRCAEPPNCECYAYGQPSE
jgi:hypothetical protein